MTSSSHVIKAFLYALQVCIVALGAFIYGWFELKISFFQTDAFLLGTVFFAIALLTVTVYQSIRISATAGAMAKGMAESMLIYSRELFTELYRGSPVPYLVIDSGLTVDSANLAALRLFSVEEGWFPGKKVFDFIKSDDEHRTSLITEYFKQRVSVNNEEVVIVRRDGHERWVLLSLFSFIDANRKHKGLLTLIDVTKQKEIDKAKTEFVSLASHQLRTPISAMKWNIELLSTSATNHFSSTEREYIEKINRGVERMENLVSDFLSVSKLELGTFVPKYESIQFGEFVNLILESYDKAAEMKQITIERAWNDHDIVRSDVHLLEMSVSNLVSNAMKYTPSGGTVKVSLEMHNKQYVIAISDTGIGIPEDEQDKVFSKIFRASNAKSEVPDGTGLGLYIVREAIRVMGGDVTFISKEGSGTTFTVTLPA